MQINQFTVSELLALGSLLATLFGFAFASLRYVNIKRKEQAQLRFENYHLLIHKLVRAKTEGTGMESQRAIIYELRNYNEYKEITVRILENLQKLWESHDLLVDEIERTITYFRPWYKLV